MDDTADEILDDEWLLRHIPGGSLWQAPGPRITSANFQLRPDRGETGVSVTRQKLTSSEQLIAIVGGSIEKGSRVAAVQTGEVRALGLKGVPKPLPGDAGHAEIQADGALLKSQAVRKRLAMLCHFLPPPA
jgi:hypothetical protein